MSTLIAVRKEMSRGSALITLMVIIMVVAVAGVAMMGFAKSQAYSATRARDFLKAQAYAEAGANQAYSLLRNDFAARNTPSKFPLHSFGDGSYDADVTAVGDTAALITCTGTRGTATAVVKLDIRNFGVPEGGSVPPTSPWAHGIFVNGYMTCNGAGSQVGSIHINNYLTQNGAATCGKSGQLSSITACGADGITMNGSVTVYGTTRAKKYTLNGTIVIDNKLTESVATIEFPTLADKFMEYYSIAVANGQVVTGNKSYNGTTDFGVIPGGVKWFTGTLTINGTVKWTGAIIAQGNITINGGGNMQQTRVGNLPCIMSRDGKLTVNGAHTMSGLVYCQGNLTWNGSGQMQGAIMTGGNLTFNGAQDNIYYVYSEPGDAGGGGTSLQDKIGVTAWQR